MKGLIEPEKWALETLVSWALCLTDRFLDQ